MVTARAHVFISGRVQGVFFRAYTRDKALELGLRGWVRNIPDGRVEAVFEGDRGRIGEMLKWCNEGSPYARVEDVEVHWEEPRLDMRSFEIRY